MPKRFRGVVFFAEDNRSDGRPDRISRLHLRAGAPVTYPRSGAPALGPLRAGDIAVGSDPV